MLLMLKDIPVMSIDMAKHEYVTLKKDLLPWGMKYLIKEYPKECNEYERKSVDVNNAEVVKDFIKRRALPLNRENAHKIYKVLNIRGIITDKDLITFCLSTRLLSLQDNFWIKNDNSSETWDNINLFNNSLSVAMFQVALHGNNSITLHATPNTPEYTNNGTFGKAWKREDDGLWLHKKSGANRNESRIEVMVSSILDNCNVQHIKYKFDENKDENICKCKCMTNQRISLVPATDVIKSYSELGIYLEEDIIPVCGEDIYKMWIIDYLICNVDRHSRNWGFFMNAETTELIELHPLFDHNLAFKWNYMLHENCLSSFAHGENTLKYWAHKAVDRTSIYFNRDFTKADFMDVDQYDYFMKRAEELKIEVNKNKSVK